MATTNGTQPTSQAQNEPRDPPSIEPTMETSEPLLSPSSKAEIESIDIEAINREAIIYTGHQAPLGECPIKDNRFATSPTELIYSGDPATVDSWKEGFENCTLGETLAVDFWEGADRVELLELEELPEITINEEGQIKAKPYWNPYVYFPITYDLNTGEISIAYEASPDADLADYNQLDGISLTENQRPANLDEVADWANQSSLPIVPGALTIVHGTDTSDNSIALARIARPGLHRTSSHPSTNSAIIDPNLTTESPTLQDIFDFIKYTHLSAESLDSIRFEPFGNNGLYTGYLSEKGLEGAIAKINHVEKKLARDPKTTVTIKTKDGPETFTRDNIEELRELRVLYQRYIDNGFAYSD